MRDDGDVPADVVAAAAGDAEAQGRLWRAHRRWVAAILLARGVVTADLDDVLQDVAMAFVGNIRGLRAPAAFRGWLRTIAMHAAQAANERRQRRGEVVPLPEDGGPPPAASAPAQGDGGAEALLQRVLATLANMQPEYREPMWLRAVQGLSQRQIAATLGLPLTTVETRLARGRRMLRASFEPATTRAASPRATVDPSTK